jgi:superfamily II DNA or RNA helicase
VKAQLDLSIAVEFRGSKPVPEPVEPMRSSSERIDSSSETSEIVNGFAVPNRLANSSMIPAGTRLTPLGGKNLEPVSGQQAPIGEGEWIASLSPSPGMGGRDQEPDGRGATPVLVSGTAGTGAPKLSPDETRGGSRQQRLRPYQGTSVALVEEQFRAGCKSTLLVLPTGAGKTVVAAALVRIWIALGERILFLAHRTELLEQAQDKFARAGIKAEIEQADRRASAKARVVIASVQTLRGARLERFAHDAFDKIIVDEAHHSRAVSYENILEHFPRARVLGVTATPDRADGKALGEAFESVAYTYEMRAAMRDGWLVPLRARRVILGDVDLSSVRTHHGDFDQGELAKLLTAEKAVHAVCGPIVQLGGKRKTLVFSVDVAHAHAIAEVLNRHTSGSALALDGTASSAERKAAIGLFAKGAIQYLVNCALFTEGFDEPSVECVAIARPTLSRALYTQMLGRGTRLLGLDLAESIANGKADCLVLDIAGNSARHRLIGPADALAGRDVDDAERELIEKNLDGQQDLEAVLAHAEAEAAAQRAKVSLVAIGYYRTKEVDPFIGDFMPPPDPNAPWSLEPATAGQLEAIEKAGFSKPPVGLTKGEASAMIDAVKKRREAGLCSVPQCQLLGRLGLDTRTMTSARAAQLFAKARSKGVGGFRKGTFMFEPEFRRTR